MKITDSIIQFDKHDDKRIWEVLNEYRQYRLTSSDGIDAIQYLILTLLEEHDYGYTTRKQRPMRRVIRIDKDR